jgi:type IV pili sensor histidine kinase/response regulator
VLDGFSIPCLRTLRNDDDLEARDCWTTTLSGAEFKMKRSISHPRHLTAAIAIWIAGIGSVASVNLQASDIQVARYSLLAATPTKAQIAPLAEIVTIQFPDRIRTVGDAVRHLLSQSGYRLAGPKAMGPEAAYLFALPMPAVQRNLGPMPLQRALETLAGPTFLLIEDPVHRLVAFELCSMEWQAAQTANRPASLQR